MMAKQKPVRGTLAIAAAMIVVLLQLTIAHGTSSTPPPPIDPARVDLNTARAAELQLLPGIGPALAQRIVDDRIEHGPFTTVDTLQRVKRIGPATVERLRPFAAVDASRLPELGRSPKPA